MECPDCGTPNPEGAVFCSQCSTSLSETSHPTLASGPDETLPGELLTKLSPVGDSPSETLLDSEHLASAARKGLEIPPTESVDIFAADFAASNPEAYEFYTKGLRAFSDYRHEEAETALLLALDSAPDFTMAKYRLVLLFAETGRTDEALELI